MSPTTARRIGIVVDSRESRSGIIKRLQDDDRFEVTVRPLKIGDYWIDGDLAIERKSSRDFYRSIFDGKIFRQLSQLRRASSRCLLLVEGLQRSRAFARLPNWLTGALLTMTAGYQIPGLLTFVQIG
ncbi:ERCC4 domain-containing protein, partial [Planctomycetota bacterium]